MGQIFAAFYEHLNMQPRPPLIYREQILSS